MMHRTHGGSSVFTPPSQSPSLCTTTSISSRSNENIQIRTVREEMDDENASCTHDGEEDAHLSLPDLPVEVFLHICSFLDASTLVQGLSLVCKQFYLNLNDDIPWKARINRIWPDASHPLLCPARPDTLFWMSSCVAFEKQTMLWQQQNSMQKVTIKIENGRYRRLMGPNTQSYACKAPVLLRHMNGITYIVSVMDRTLLCCCTLSFREKLPSHEVRNTDEVSYAKEVFPWDPTDCLTAIDHTIYGCLLNNTVKSWVLTNTGLVYQGTYDTDWNNERRDSLYCIASCPERNLFATGSYSDIYVFDPRTSNKPIQLLHKAVRKLAMNTEYILSVDEENTVSVWDQRAGRIMKSIRIPGSPDAFPTCISMRRDWVCVGDNKAKLHMLDLKNDFELVKSYSTEHTRSITGVRLTHGCLITSSKDGYVRISSPTDPPKPIATYSWFREISMDYLNDTLAISDCEGNIAVYRCPK